MPLTFPGDPPDSHEVLQGGLALSLSAIDRTGRPLRISRGFAVFTADLFAAFADYFWRKLPNTHWRYFLMEPNSLHPILYSDLARRGTRLVHAHATTGPRVQWAVTSLSLAEDAAGAVTYELRLLDIPGIGLYSVWLAEQPPGEGSGDLFLPLGPPPALGQVCDATRFANFVRARAKARLG